MITDSRLAALLALYTWRPEDSPIRVETSYEYAPRVVLATDGVADLGNVNLQNERGKAPAKRAVRTDPRYSYGYSHRTPTQNHPYVPHYLSEDDARVETARVEAELRTDPTLCADWKALVAAVQSVSDDDMERAFGDPARVVVTRDGLSVEEAEPAY